MERDDRPAVATFFTDASLVAGATLSLSDSAAHHARVKRLEVGDVVRLTDGAGAVAIGDLALLDRGRADVVIARVEQVARPAAIHLCVPIGDRERMLWLAEKATELGIASWRAVRFRRSASVSPRGEGPPFAAKVRARMIAALEQSGGAWLPTVLGDATVDELANGQDAPGVPRILLDAAGRPVLDLLTRPVGECVLVFGPEGGLESAERDVLRGAGYAPAALAATTLRFETAGVAAVAVVRAAQARDA